METAPPNPLTFAHYELLGEIGRGGMGVVFRARDTRLGREVAIKVLPTRVASDPERRARFLREARAAARLNHPVIATVYEAGEARVEDLSFLEGSGFGGTGPRDLVYIAMEYVEGRDLGSLLKEGLTLKQTLDYGIQIAEGLGAAHARGVIHRDLKPGNVRITPEGKAKILDFGLAKTLRETEEETDDPTLTAHGGIVGTVPYMAPEQLQGTGVDARSDLFSFGVVLYQMLTGRVPFDGARLVDYVKALTGRRPLRPSKSNPEISPALERVVDRLLAREPAERFATADEVVGELKSIARSRPASDSKPSPLPVPGDSLFSDISRSWSGRRGLAVTLGLAVLLLALAGGVWLRGRHVAAPSVRNVAVLPFENRTSDPGLTAYYEGVGSFLTLKLSKVRGINVESELEMRRFRGTVKSPAEIARELGVGTLLLGYVQGDAERVRVVVQMLDAATGTIIWFDEVEGEGGPGSLLELQERLADKVLEKLAVGLSASERSRLRRNPTEVSEAYDAYLDGVRMLEEVSNPAKATEAERLFQSALVTDPQFSWAYAGLSRALLRRYDFERDPSLLEEAARDANRAVALEPDSPQLLVLRARVNRTLGRYAAAESDLEAVLAINPDLDSAHRELALTYEQENRLEAAENAYRRAVELRPLSWQGWNELGGFLLEHGRPSEAKPALEEAMKLAPEEVFEPLENLATLVAREDPQAALALYGKIEESTRSASTWTNMGGCAFFLGRFEEAEGYYRRAAQLQPAEPSHWMNLGDALHSLHRQEEARESYSRAVRLVREQLGVRPLSPHLRSLEPLLLAKAGECDSAVSKGRHLVTEFEGNVLVLRRLAKSFAVCRDRSLTLATLETLSAEGDSSDWFAGEPEFEWLAEDPHLRSLSEKSGPGA